MVAILFRPRSVEGNHVDKVTQPHFDVAHVSVDDPAHELITTIVNPFTNLFHYYFGAEADRYVNILVKIIFGITVLLLLLYMIAALFAAVLIFSISRAVNRIEKGTKAVERGDFSYRIGMKPRNQRPSAEAVIAEGIQILVKQVSLFTPEFEEKLKSLKNDEARASEMEHAIKNEIHVKLDENPAFFRSLPSRGASRTEVRLPKRLNQSFWPARSVT